MHTSNITCELTLNPLPVHCHFIQTVQYIMNDAIYMWIIVWRCCGLRPVRFSCEGLCFSAKKSSARISNRILLLGFLHD